jgi:hypothetical protein
MNYCTRPLRADSQALAQEAERIGVLDEFHGYCECEALVGAVRKPHLDGPKGGPLHPTDHYPPEPRKPRDSGKRNTSKT